MKTHTQILLAPFRFICHKILPKHRTASLGMDTVSEGAEAAQF